MAIISPLEYCAIFVSPQFLSPKLIILFNHCVLIMSLSMIQFSFLKSSSEQYFIAHSLLSFNNIGLDLLQPFKDESIEMKIKVSFKRKFILIFIIYNINEFNTYIFFIIKYNLKINKYLIILII